MSVQGSEFRVQGRDPGIRVSGVRRRESAQAENRSFGNPETRTLTPGTLLKRAGVLSALVIALSTLGLSAAVAVPEEQVRSAEMTPEIEKAIARGLTYLRLTQNDDGSWGTHFKITQTSLSIMALMVPGHDPRDELYGKSIDRAITYLLGRAKHHGGYFADETSQVLYQHSFAVLALSEAWGQSKRPDIGPALKAAVEILLRSQGPSGGWRYQPRPSGTDISCTGTAIQGLTSAREAGILVPDHVIHKALRCMRAHQSDRTGYFNYGHGGGGGGNPTLYRCGIGPLSLYMLGDRNSVFLRRGLAVLIKQPDTVFSSGGAHFHLAHYYCIQTCYQAGDEYFGYWYPRISRALLGTQAADGSWSGGSQGGMSTSLAVLILGVPYRYLPIYQR